VDGIGNSTAPSDSASPDDSTGMSQVSPAGYGSDSGWLWARDYDEDGHGDWTGTPWVGSGDFSSDDLKGVLNNSNYEVYYDGSFSGMTIQYYGGTNSSWQSSRPTISSSSDTVRARVAYGSLQVSQEIQKNGFDVPESPVNPFSITCTLSYSTSQGWVLMLASDKVYSYSVMAYDVEKNNLEASVSANDITGTRSINLAKKSDRYELTITDSEGNVYTRNENLTEKSYILP
jgi:hypothetical protein